MSVSAPQQPDSAEVSTVGAAPVVDEPRASLQSASIARTRRDGLEVALAVVAAIALQIVQVAVLGLGDDHDAEVYRDYARSWSDGQAPFRDFSPEYPGGAMFLFEWAFLSGGADIDWYRQAFAWEMSAFVIAGAVLVLLHARRLWPASRWRRALAVVLYLVALAGVSPLVHRRFDLVPAVLVLLALYLEPGADALLSGIATGVKLWPCAVFAYQLASAARNAQWRTVAKRALYFTVGVAAMLLPFVPRAGTGVFDFLRYHMARNFQVESSWAFLAFALAAIGGPQTHVDFEHGADHVVSDAVPLLRPVSSVVTVALVLAPVALLVIRRRRDQADEATNRSLMLHGATAVVAGFLLGSKVLSPQFLLWLSPLAALTCLDGGGRWKSMVGALLCAAAPVLTTLIYLRYYTDLCDLRATAFVVAGLRLASLAGLYGLALARIAHRQPRDASRTHGMGSLGTRI